MINIVICEDQINQLRNFELMLKRIFEKKFQDEYKIVLLESDPLVVKNFVCDFNSIVYFLDISLNNKVSGIELAKDIYEKNPNAYIVFVSEQLSFVFNSFKARPFDFLPKPVSENILMNCLEEILQDVKFKELDKSKLSIKIGALTHYINKSEIVSIESLMGKTLINLINKNTLITYNTLDFYEDLLDNADNFFRCHRSFIVNKKHITSVDFKGMNLIMSNGQTCHIGRMYKKGVI